MNWEKESEIKKDFDSERDKKLADKITYIILAIITLYFAGHIIFYLIEDKPEIPTIDGVPMRNEAQMFNGYNQ